MPSNDGMASAVGSDADANAVSTSGKDTVSATAKSATGAMGSGTALNVGDRAGSTIGSSTATNVSCNVVGRSVVFSWRTRGFAALFVAQAFFATGLRRPAVLLAAIELLVAAFAFFGSFFPDFAKSMRSSDGVRAIS